MTMILGLGTDLCDVARMERELTKNPALQEELFTSAEIAFCAARRYAARHFAARFAAKEALFKALGSGKRGRMSWRDVEVRVDKLGKPLLAVSGATAEAVNRLGAKHIHLSLSHTGELALATVVLEN